ncbi:uncharacterized protein J7T54_005841 [Emericellopsis cladophorae]|uniref:N-acetyltransferase domain-containing protein n=1 Tax=Emericellopsis cladophorae TaxID=2686198 RepID=A0A9Q0BBB6_9HYPO|nr:uncharacterized protein J7T54_005841 [Emericellopsis cladophorae]KAI6778325.1 hypothetical protein J7T54_005841 [Emericellopsis cladophorae]
MQNKIRAATFEDLPSVVKVILAAINKERLWTNFVPSKTGQDESYVKEIEALLREHLDPSNKDWVIEVIDLAKNGQPSQIVSVAVWDMSAAEDDDRKKRDVKTEIKDDRLSAYTTVVSKARNEFFNRYPQHSYLQLLATHPDHQNHGYAKDLVHSHMVKAKQKGGVLTTLGGPFGYIFFSGLGFHDLGPVSLPPSSASDSHIIKAMSLTVPKEERRQSIVDSVLNYISS